MVWYQLMAKTFFKIEGLSELTDALVNELPKATATNIQKRALKEAADPIEADAKRFSPVRTGLLRERINISTKLSKRQKTSNKKESKIEIYIGPPSMARGIISEFGSVKESPRPFMRPAWDANKRTAFKTLRDILADEIEKARQRALRKTARLLAKTS
jgi:HK97 gp10 family phage protein